MAKVIFHGGPQDALELEDFEMRAVSHSLKLGGVRYFLMPSTSDECRRILAFEATRPGPWSNAE